MEQGGQKVNRNEVGPAGYLTTLLKHHSIFQKHNLCFLDRTIKFLDRTNKAICRADMLIKRYLFLHFYFQNVKTQFLVMPLLDRYSSQASQKHN